MRVAEPQPASLAVHQDEEPRSAAAGGDRERGCVVVPGIEQQAVEELPHADPLARSEPFLHQRHLCGLRVHPDQAVQRQALEGEEGGHDLRGRGDRPPAVGAERPQDSAGARVDEDRRAGAERGDEAAALERSGAGEELERPDRALDRQRAAAAGLPRGSPCRRRPSGVGVAERHVEPPESECDDRRDETRDEDEARPAPAAPSPLDGLEYPKRHRPEGSAAAGRASGQRVRRKTRSPYASWPGPPFCGSVVAT